MMDSRSRWITQAERVAAAGALPALLAILLLVVAAGSGAMTNEDVVRMTARKVPEAGIVQAIREAPATAFDLDPEVVAELRRAGVAEVVIDAMRGARPAPAPPAPEPPPASGSIELSFDRRAGARGSKQAALLPARVAGGDETALAFFICCLEPTHVPDLWQTRTPLSEGFPRHHLIWFHEATRPWKEGSTDGLVYLDLPERASIEAPEGLHPLQVGIAARAGRAPWAPLAEARGLLQVRQAAATRLVVRVRTKAGGLLRPLPGGGRPHFCEIVLIDPPPQLPATAEPGLPSPPR